MTIERKVFFDCIKRNWFFNLAILACAFMASCIWGYACYVAYAILLYFVLVNSLEDGISYLVASFPFYLIENFLSSILFFICVFAYLIKFFIVVFGVEKHKITLKEIIPAICLLVYIVLPIGPYNMNTFLKVSLIIFVLAVVCGVSKKAEVLNLTKNIRILAIALMVSAIMSFVVYVPPLFVFHEAFRFKALFNNTNVLSMSCEIVLALLAAMIVIERKWYDWLLFAFIAILGVATISKMYLIALAIILIALFIFYLKIKPKATIIVASSLVVGLVVLCLINPSILRAIFARFKVENNRSGFTAVLESITTYRYGIWIGYLTYLFKNPLRLIFGCGLGAYRLPGLNSSHNMLLGMIYQLGLVGSALFIAAIVMLLKANKKSQKAKFNKAYIIPIIILCLIMQVEDLIFFINRL